MRLTTKFGLLTTAAALSALVALIGVSRLVLERHFAALDQEHAGASLRLLHALVRAEHDGIASLMRDWSEWDDCWKFVRGEAPDFAASNLQANGFANNGLDLAAFFDTKGRVTSLSLYDRHAEALIDGSGLRTLLESTPALHRFTEAGQEALGALPLPDGGALLVAAGPVLPSSGEGEIGGALVFGRLLDRQRLDAWGHEAGFTVALARGDAPAGGTAQPLDGRFLRGMLPLPVLAGTATLRLEGDLARSVYIQGLKAVNAIALTIAVVLALFLAVWAALFRRQLARPIAALTACAGDLAQRRWQVRAPQEGSDELAVLGRTVNGMAEALSRYAADLEAQVEARTAELQAEIEKRTRANRDLACTLAELNAAQSQLVQAEKLAALGGMVAGIAHEINTPIGIGITAVSHLHAELVRLRHALADGALKRSELDAFLGQADDAAGMVAANLDRAGGLVRSFKQVAVDQTSEVRRRIDLLAYAREVAVSLAPRFKGTPFACRVEGETGITLDTHPGPLAQVLTNLVNNALLHGLEGRAAGEVAIRVRREGAEAVIEVADDGAGMDEAVRARMFEPFFTTKRGQGGTGLGLPLCFNLVTQRLGGTIACDSAPGRGTVFRIRLPLTPPASGETA